MSHRKTISLVLLVLGIVVFGVGLYGWLLGDLNLTSLQHISEVVYEARKEARSFEIPITGTVDLFGEGRGSVPIALLSL
ncbi:MAG: hypothetical protein GX249_05920, partial [Firmicutes bacterium]|nr:hypothetical protein [Bacillota bacterium]